MQKLVKVRDARRIDRIRPARRFSRTRTFDGTLWMCREPVCQQGLTLRGHSAAKRPRQTQPFSGSFTRPHVAPNRVVGILLPNGISDCLVAFESLARLVDVDRLLCWVLPRPVATFKRLALLAGVQSLARAGYVQSAKPTKGGVCKECIERTGVKAFPNRNG